MIALKNIFVNIVRACVSFRGRIGRRQYWIFIVIACLLMLMFLYIDEYVTFISLAKIYAALMVLPYLSSSVKRLHDVNKSGFWILIGFLPIIGWLFLFILFIENGSDKGNKYGSVTDLSRECSWGS